MLNVDKNILSLESFLFNNIFSSTLNNIYNTLSVSVLWEEVNIHDFTSFLLVT
jgi:hypothetical protein